MPPSRAVDLIATRGGIGGLHGAGRRKTQGVRRKPRIVNWWRSRRLDDVGRGLDAQPALSNQVAIEAHSDLRRLEQQVRWAADKSEALANTELARFASEAGTREPAISRLMLLRSSRHTRELARTFERTLAAAYPARPADVFAALTRPDDPWPGAGMLWATLDGTEAHVLASAPRGVRLGR